MSPPPTPPPFAPDPVWSVHWHPPRPAPAYAVTRHLTHADALQVAAGVNRTATERGWRGEVVVVLDL